MTQLQFERLIQLHGDSIYGFCCHLTGRVAEAEDLYHDSVLKAFSKLRKIKCEGEDDGAYLSARNYIIGIAVRLARSSSRRLADRSRVGHDENETCLTRTGSPEDIERDTERRELSEQIRRTVSALPEKLRSVTYMFYYADMSIADIGAALHIPSGTVKSRLSRSRDIIRKELEEKGYENY
ncbi:MAG: RNA polymerase sigma factor [Ruminococcus sp.]|nr:RNA polymerase sigma factor [Ruminococcus sp.]